MTEQEKLKLDWMTLEGRPGMYDVLPAACPDKEVIAVDLDKDVAEFIVRAANAHHPMLNALHDATMAIMGITEGDTIGVLQAKVLAEARLYIRAAITKASKA